jgi:hypothetical protein
MKTFRGFIVGLKTRTSNIIKPTGQYVKKMLHQVRLFSEKRKRLAQGRQA